MIEDDVDTSVATIPIDRLMRMLLLLLLLMMMMMMMRLESLTWWMLMCGINKFNTALFFLRIS